MLRKYKIAGDHGVIYIQVTRGAVIADGPYEEVSKNPQVIEAYMGSADTELQGAH